jgi:zinc-ribbon domain
MVITKTATLKNNSPDTVTIRTGKSDFQSNGINGTPSFVRKSELVYPDQELSTWISIDTPEFTILPGSEKTINFTITVPTNATPGGHYGAVFFKNPNSEVATSGNIGIDVDYGVLILVNVTGETDTEWEIPDNGIIATGGSSKWGSGGGERELSSNWLGFILGETFDGCVLWDFSKSNFDGKCFDAPFSKEPTATTSPWVTLADKYTKDLDISFQIPFENIGNTHIKPLGKIILKDEDGLELKSIGREAVINELGAIVGEEIVDYLPINDIGGNVLPKTKRLFEAEWKGFPHKTVDIQGNEVIEYWTPSEYYTKKNIEENNFLMFWERVCEARRYKKITALIEVNYTDENGKEIEFNSARDVEIEYIESYIWKNPYVFIPLLFLLCIGGIWFLRYSVFVLIARKRKCPHCKKPVKKEWSVCPHCEWEIKKQKNKKKK